MNVVAPLLPANISKAIDAPNAIIFASFLLATAGLTSTTIMWLKNSQRLDSFAFSVVLASVIASWMVGFSAEELVLVCLPLIIGSSILFSCVFGCKKPVMVEREKAQLMNEV
jgi:hypothetical protein